MSKRRGRPKIQNYRHCKFKITSNYFNNWIASEVVIARGRLKGALQDIANVAEDDEDLDSNKPSRGRPPKRVKKELTPPPQTSVQHSFLMKLFDRCVDLAKYNEDTPLYPICRAWMINQPRSNQIIK